MPFFNLSKKRSNLIRAASADVASDPLSGDAGVLPQRRRETEPTTPLPRPWKRRGTSTPTRASSSLPMEPALPVAQTVESPAPEAAIREMPTPMPLPTGPGVFFTNLAMVPPTEMIPTISPVPDLLSATWDDVKDGPKGGSIDRGIDVIGKNRNFVGQDSSIDYDFGYQATPSLL